MLKVNLQELANQFTHGRFAPWETSCVHFENDQENNLCNLGTSPCSCVFGFGNPTSA